MNKKFALNHLTFVIHPRPSQMSGIHLIFVIGYLTLFIFLSCCGYSTRSLLPDYFQKVHVELFENRTLKSGLDELATNAVTDAFRSGSGLHISDESSADIIIEATHLEDKIKDADLVITGEGSMDRQTFFGKSAYGIAKLARKYNIPVITINGSVLIGREDIDKNYSGLTDGNFSIINKPMEPGEAIRNGKKLLKNTVKELITFYLSAIEKSKHKKSGRFS